jgi:hypothetical protein
MSIDVQTTIRNTCLYRGGEFAVLMAMADCANTGDGRGIYPGIDLLAANARMSVRQCQENIKRLRAAGVVILVGPDGEDLGPDEMPAGGRGRKTEWRIDLERVQELQGLHEQGGEGCDFCKARLERAKKRVQFGARKGEVSPRKGEVCDTKGEVSRSPIEEPTEPSEEPSPTIARARDGEAGPGKQTLPRKRAYPDGFERIWTEFRKCPGFSENMSKPDALKAYEQLANVRPSDGDLVVAVRAFGRFLAAENERRAAKRDTPHPMAHPATWLRSQRWTGFLDALVLDPDPTPRPTTLKPDDVARLRKTGFEDPLIAEWFVDGEFLDAETFAAATEFKRNWIRSKFGARLERAGIVNIIVRAESKAA